MFLKGELSRDLQTRVLRQWDRCDNDGILPFLTTDENSAYGCGRLSAFRSSGEWLTTFEILSYVVGVCEYVCIVYSYGNRVKKHLEWLDFLHPSPKHAIGDRGWLPNPRDFEVRLHKEHLALRPTCEQYAEAGIDLNTPISGDLSTDRHIQILRVLPTVLSPSALFLPSRCLLAELGRPTTLPVFLQVYGWHHPEFRRKPSENPCLRSLAHALAEDQPSLYKCPTHLINTHWSHWPNYWMHDRK